jgi:hypothetical protein
VRRIVVLAIALLVMLIGLWYELRDVAEPVAMPSVAPTQPATPAPPQPQPVARAVVPVIATVPSPPPDDGHATTTPPPVLDGVDPCAAVEEPPLPPTFDVKSVGNITIAWRTDPKDTDEEPISPMMIGRIAEGILEDAADATGTTVRAHLTVVIYPTLTQLRADTHAPVWAGGLYDGAVRLAASRFEDVGVSLAVMRHEIMHAQLHVAVGCMPAWFNEGIATYFENNPNIHAMVDLVREHELVDVDALSTPGIQELPTKHPGRLYAQSLAMVMYALDHAPGGPELRTLVGRYTEARRDHRLTIWSRWFPDVHAAELVEYVAHRVFGMATGGALDAILHGTVCCAGWRDLSKLACRAPGTPPPEGRTIWSDRSRTPPALCDTHFSASATP